MLEVARLKPLWHDIFSLQKTTPRLHPALRLTISVAIVFFISSFAHQPSIAKVGIISAMVAGYGYGMSFSRRLRIQFAATLFMVILVLVGSFTHDHRLLRVFYLVISFTIITFLSLAFKIGPPGAYIICLDAGMSTVLPFHLAYIFWVLLSGGVAMLVTYTYSFFVKLHQQSEDFYLTRTAMVDYCQAITQNDISVARKKRTAALTALSTNTSVLETTKRQLRRNPKRREFFRLNALLQETFIDFFYHELAIKKQSPEDLAYMTREISTLHPREAGHYPTSKNLASYRRTFITTRPRWYTRIRTSFNKYSIARRTALRVLVASTIAEVIMYHNLDIHTYWAPATAVVILHTGPGSQFATVSRALQRTLGCLAGVVLGVLLLKWDVQGFGLLAILLVLLFIIEIIINRNYALASMFVTPATMLTSTSLPLRENGWDVLLQRSLDTIVGCCVAVLVSLVAIALLRKKYLWMELDELIIAGYKLIITAIPDKPETEVFLPFSITPAYEAQSAELLHMRLELEQLLPVVPQKWIDKGTARAIQTAKNFADLALTMHLAAKERTEKGETLREYADKLIAKYEGQLAFERIVEIEELH